MSTPGVPSWVADLEHLHALNEPALATDTAGLVVFGNAAAAWRHGTLGEEGWATISSLLVPEEDDGVLTEIFQQALQGTSWEGRLDVRHVDGSVQPAEVVCTPLRRGEEIVGTLWVSDYAVGRGRAGARDPTPRRPAAAAGRRGRRPRHRRHASTRSPRS